MQTMTVSEAKPQLGHLVDLALNDTPVFIRRGDRVVQLVPAVLPSPFPLIPEGALTRSAEQIAFLSQSASEDEGAPFER